MNHLFIRVDDTMPQPCCSAVGPVGWDQCVQGSSLENLQDRFNVKNMTSQACYALLCTHWCISSTLLSGTCGCLVHGQGLAQLHSGAPSLSWRCLLPVTFHRALMSLLGTCATPAPPLCLITGACVDEEGLGKEMRIAQSHLAKIRQDTKSNSKVVPQPIPAAGPGGHKFKQNGLFIKVCSGGSAEALQSELCQGAP